MKTQLQGIHESNPVDSENVIKTYENDEPLIHNEEYQKSDLENKLTNFPIKDWEYWEKQATLPTIKKNCGKYPISSRIKYGNTLWQVEQDNNEDLFVFGAYYDNRKLVHEPLVRIISMTRELNLTSRDNNYFCQFWYKDINKIHYTKVETIELIWPRPYGYSRTFKLLPYVFSCPVNKDNITDVPDSVSLVNRWCSYASNNLKVIYNKGTFQNDSIAVCVKGFSFMDQSKSIMLIEWLELIKLLGGKKVFMYEYEYHEDSYKVMQHYIQNGFLSLSPLVFPKYIPTIPGFVNKWLKIDVLLKRQNEVLAYNDCFYKNMYRYKYIALLDTDEMIMGKNKASWKQIIDDLMIEKKAQLSIKEYSSYCARNIYFLNEHQHHPDIPNYMHMLQRTKRSVNFTGPGSYIKCFHDTQRAKYLHNHFPTKCLTGLTGYCASTEFNLSKVSMQHYRSFCHGEIKNCFDRYWNNTIQDQTIFAYKDELINQVKKAISDIGL